MSQNKFIHPRNMYKVQPNYTDLAVKYAKFRKLCKLNLDGTVRIDLRDERTLISLTQTLLCEDFGLNVDFALNSLVPTVPLRLNYLLWIEDILSELKVNKITGIDIGCGSSCIYSLLAAKRFRWSMVSLECNLDNLKYARKNVTQNHLSDLITVVLQENNYVIFEGLLKDSAGDEVYDFCLCNPPFFDHDNRKENEKNRSGHRKPPKNCPTGKDNELYCDGGEISFVKKIVDESLKLQTRVRVYSTMVGQKSSVAEILMYLKAHNVDNYIQTTFCQGNTTRWGIAWTFYENYKLSKVSCINP